MRIPTLRATALCSGLVFLAACDSSHAPLAPLPDLPAVRQTTAPSGLVALYTFDQGAGDATVHEATYRPTGGYEGGAFHFDGVNDYVDLPVNVNPSVRPALTMGAWVRAESLPGGAPAQILSHDDGAYDRSLVLDTRGEIEYGSLPVYGVYRFSAFTGGWVLGGPEADTNRWVFVAAVYDEYGILTLYVDGVKTQAQAFPGDGVPFLRVGGNPAGAPGGEPFHGTIDNVFVFERALSEEEVQGIRAEGACAVTGTCRHVTFYSFDGGPGNGMAAGAVHQPTGGYQGGAYYFDGIDDHINLPVNVNPSVLPRATIGAWVRVASVPVPGGRSAQVLSHDDGGFDRSIALDLRGPNGALLDGQYHLSAFTGAGVLPGPVAPANAWTFVAAVYDGWMVTLYVNGDRYSATASPGQGHSYLRVGGSPAGPGFPESFHGWIDNVFVVDQPLTAAEIAAIRADGACRLAGTPCGP